jgi:hypothetical protein
MGETTKPCGCAQTPFRLARTAAGAVGRVVGAVIAGAPVWVSPATFARRLAICRICPHCVPHPPQPEYLRCAKCGCWLNGKHAKKAALATESCPINAWEAA